jgi:hypothetical protein
MFNFLKKPEYYLTPKFFFKRLFLFKKRGFKIVSSFWNSFLLVNVSESIGCSIYKFGLYELPVTELLCQIVRKGDKVIDVGANIGYATSLFSYLVGFDGFVYSFEPNKRLLPTLKTNIDLSNYKK